MRRKRGIFIAFVKKEFWHLLRDRRTLLVALLIPVVLMILFGFTINTELNNVRVGFVIPHPSESIRQVIGKFSGNPYFTAVGQIPSSRIDEGLMNPCVGAMPMPLLCFPRTSIGVFSLLGKACRPSRWRNL